MYLLNKNLKLNMENKEFDHIAFAFFVFIVFLFVLYSIKINYEDFCISRRREKYYEELKGKDSEEAELLREAIINIPH